MKNLSLNFASFIFLFVIGLVPSSYGYTQGCSLPGTPNIWVISTTTNSAEIAWDEVPTATSYEIETVEVSTGTVVSLLTTTDNTINITGLEPGRDYDVTVTTFCGNNPGGHSIIRLTTGIVVVDIVLQMNCPNPTDPNFDHPYAANELNTIPLNHAELFVIEGHFVSAPTKEFRIMFLPDLYSTSGPPKLLANTTPDFYGVLEFSSNNGSNLPKIEYRDLNNSGSPAELLATFNPVFGSSADLAITFAVDVEVDTYRCGLSGGGGGKGKGPGVILSPNPTTGLFAITAPENTRVTIVDLYGQIWYEVDLIYAEEPHTIDASSWPNGTYIVQTIAGDEPVLSTLIKTD